MEPRNPSTEAARKNVLVVDSDAQSLRIVDVSLRRAGFEVTHATDGVVAASLIERHPPPDLVISDLDLPGLDGLELCRRAKASQRQIPFIFLARPSTDNKVRAFELGADDFLSKPVFVKEVVTRVGALLQRHERERLSSTEAPGDRVTGGLADLSTIDLLQTIATNGKSGVLHLHSSSGGTGEIYFRKGAVVDAEVGRLSGSDAVYRLLSWTDGRFEIEWRNIRRRDTVALAAPALLMEGMRRLDEWTRLTQQLPPLDTVFEVDYRLLAERLADIPDEVNGILRLFDGVRTAIQVIDDCGLSDLDALTVIGKLNSEELIRNAAAKVIEPEGTGPDLEGWLSDSTAQPPAASAPPAEDEPRLRRASDLPAPRAERLHDRKDDRDDRPSAVASPSERRDRPSDHRAASSESSRSDLLPEEPAVVIPFPTSAPSPRTTLVSASGGPAAAVVGEISNGVTSPSSAHAAAAPPAPQLPDPPAPSVSIPRSTDPGLGPLPPRAVTPPPAASPAAPAPVVAPPPVVPPAPIVAAAPPVVAAAPAPAAPAPARAQVQQAPTPHHAPAAAPSARRDSGPKVPDLPFSDSASRWMNEGDEIHSSRNTKAEAIEELGLPSRNRGLVYVAAVAVLAGGMVFGIRHFRGETRGQPVAVTSQAPAAAPVPAPEPSPAAKAPDQPGEKLADNSAANPPIEKITTPEAANGAAAATAPGAAAAAPTAAGEPGAAPAQVSPEFPQLLTACQTTFNAGRMRDATTACTAAVEANPDSPKAVALLAHAEFNRSHRKEALSWAEKAIKLDSKTADAYVIIGGVQQDAGRNADAKAAYRKYLELAPKGQYAADLRAIVDSL